MLELVDQITNDDNDDPNGIIGRFRLGDFISRRFGDGIDKSMEARVFPSSLGVSCVTCHYESTAVPSGTHLVPSGQASWVSPTEVTRCNNQGQPSVCNRLQ